MTSPTNNLPKLHLPSIREDLDIKTFRPTQKCSICGRFKVSAKLMEMLEQGKTSAICSVCLQEQFKASQEVKVKRLKTYQVTPFPVEKKDK